MRVVNVIGGRSQKYGGLERFNVELGGQLQKAGDKLALIYESLPSSSQYREDLNKNGVELIIRPLRRHYFSYIGFITKYLIENRPEVLHVHFDPAGYICLILAKIVGVKKRLKTLHSMLGTGGSQLAAKTVLLKRMMYWASNNVLTVSDAIREESAQRFKFAGKMETLYLGVSSEKIADQGIKSKYNIPANKFIITCVAFHGHIKGIDILIKALAVLKQKYRCDNFLCLQVGGGFDDYLIHLKGIVHKHNLGNEIRWMGLQDNVPEIYAISDVCVQPSRSEGIPLALMEASMQSLPLIGTNVGGIPEVISDGENGYLTGVEDPEDIAEKIYRLISDSVLRKDMGRNARAKAIRSFDISKNVGKLINKYSE